MVRSKHRRAAEKACLASTAEPIKVGAVAFCGSRMLGTGRNYTDKTHPISRNRFKKIHAEEDLIRRYELEGSSVFVTRSGESGFTMAKPCLTCQSGLRDAGVRHVYFTDWNGSMRRLW